MVLAENMSGVFEVYNKSRFVSNLRRLLLEKNNKPFTRIFHEKSQK